MSLRNDDDSPLRQAERRAETNKLDEQAVRDEIVALLWLQDGLFSLECGYEKFPEKLYDAYVMLCDVLEGWDPVRGRPE